MQLFAAVGWSLMFAVGRAPEASAAWSTTLEIAEQLGDAGYPCERSGVFGVDRMNNGEFRKAEGLARVFASAVSIQPM